MSENLASSPKPMSSTNAMDPIVQTPLNTATMPSPSNLSHSSPVDIPQISSPSLSQISQHQQPQQQSQLQQHQPTLHPQKPQQLGFNVNPNLQQQQQLTPQQFQHHHQHQNIIGMGLSGLQSQQSMHRSASVSRMNQIQQQQQQDFQQQQVLQQQVPQQQQQQQQLEMLRQTANVYGQMNFGGTVMSQQQLGQQSQQQQHQQHQLLQQSQQQLLQQSQQQQLQSQQQQSQQQQLQSQQQQSQQLQQPQQQQQSQQLQQSQQQQQHLQQSQQQQQHLEQSQQQQHLQQSQQQQHLQQSQQQQVHPQAQQQQSSQQPQPSQQQQQAQPQQMASGNFSRSSLTGQSGHLPVLPSQAASAQFNMLTSPRQRASIIQGSQLQAGNAPGQTMQGLQALQMMGSLGFGSQIRANTPMNYGQQRINPSQLRQQLSQQNSLSPQKLQGQTLPRTSSHLAFMNPQLSGLSQNGQAMMPNTLSQQQQQQWLKQMPSMTSPNAHSLRLQQHQRQLLQQKLTSSSALQQNMPFNPQQLSHLVQQQSMGHSQLQQPHQSNQILQQHQSPNMLQAHQQSNQILQQQQQQQSQKIHGHAKSMSLTGSQPDATLSGTTTQGGSSSQGTEATNQLLGKRKIQDLVSQVDPQARLDDEVQDILLCSADDFIDSVLSYACKLAKHRKSSILEAKDVLLHLERNWHLTLPGYSTEDKEHQRDTAKNDVHRKRLDMIRNSKEYSQHEEVLTTSVSRDTMRQGMMANVSGGNNVVRPMTPDLDQLQSITGPLSHQQGYDVLITTGQLSKGGVRRSTSEMGNCSNRCGELYAGPQSMGKKLIRCLKSRMKQQT